MAAVKKYVLRGGKVGMKISLKLVRVVQIFGWLEGYCLGLWEVVGLVKRG